MVPLLASPTGVRVRVSFAGMSWPVRSCLRPVDGALVTTTEAPWLVGLLVASLEWLADIAGIAPASNVADFVGASIIELATGLLAAISGAADELDYYT